MQDNQWDEQFRDHAWQEMRQLLDREMPARRRRRRAGWLFLAAFLLLGAGAYVLWKMESSAEALPPASAREMPASPAPSSDPAPESQPGAQRAATIPDPASGRPESAPPTARRPARPPATISAAPTGSALLPALSAEAGPPEASAQATKPEIAATPEPAPQNKPERSPSGPAAPLAVPPPIESLTPSPLEYGEILRPGARRAKASLLPSHWGVRSALLGGNGQVLNGAGLALIAEYRLGHSRWSLRTGLEYLYLHREMRRPQTGGAFDLAAEEDPTPANPGSEDAGTGGSYAVPLPSALRFRSHGLSLPLSLHRRLGKRFQLGVGTQLIYSFRNLRQAVDESLAPNSFGNLQDRNTRGLFFQNATAPLEREVFRRFDVALTGSLYYRPAARWQLELTYHYGLNDLAPSVYYEAYNRFGSLGVVYFLK